MLIFGLVVYFWRKKNTHIYHQKQAVEISRAHEEERELGEFDTHQTYCRQERQRKSANNLPNLLGEMIGRTVIKSDSGKANFTES